MLQHPFFKDSLLSPWGANTQKQGKTVRNWKEGLNFTPEINAPGSHQLPHWPGFRAKPRRRIHLAPVQNIKNKTGQWVWAGKFSKAAVATHFFPGNFMGKSSGRPKPNEIWNRMFSAVVFLISSERNCISCVT